MKLDSLRDELLKKPSPPPDKEVFTLQEAADYMGITQKTLQNKISQLKKDHGRLPDWVCDGAGTTVRNVKREEFISWLSGTKRRRGRPGKKIS